MRLRHPNEVESVRQARRSIALIRQRLLKPAPEALDACVPHLRNAVESIEWLQHSLGTGYLQAPGSKRTLEIEIDELRHELTLVTALMRNASGFYSGLSRLLSPPEDDSLNYAPGRTIASRPMPTLQLEG